MGLLDTHYDPALEVDLAASAEAVEQGQVERLEAELASAAYAAAFPRRLSDASREELALDKRRSRRVAHVLRQSLLGWGGKERVADAEEQSAGAQVDWPLWQEEYRSTLLAELRRVSTWAKKTDNLRFGKSAVTRLQQELEWVDYAMRD